MRGNRLTERAEELDRDDRLAYRIRGRDDSVSTKVIRGIEEIVGEDEDKRTWLYDSVDPDALDAIFEEKHDGTPRSEGKVLFTARGCEVTVHGDGSVTIHAPKDLVEE